PPRVRKDARDLAPKWERRELGVQASREWAEHPGGTFLERVRASAGPDLQQAKSWDELDQRLERHGLRVEPKGVGMVVTDGRHYVKASSVDREASRGKLEKRFGVTLAEHRTNKLERRGLPPKAKDIADDLRTLDLRARLKAGLARETERLEAARARLAEGRWARERADRASRAFDDALGRAFAEPQKAREAFEGRARESGPERAADEMRQNPEAFGSLREGEKRRKVGLARSTDRDLAREAARNAAELGRESVTAAGLAPDPATLTRAE